MFHLVAKFRLKVVEVIFFFSFKVTVKLKILTGNCGLGL